MTLSPYLSMLLPKVNDAASLGLYNTLSRMSLSGANVEIYPGSEMLIAGRPMIYNPGVIGPAASNIEIFLGDYAVHTARDFARQAAPGILESDIRFIEEGELCHLGDVLVTLAGRLTSRSYDLVVFPIRAGHRIRQILDGMLEVHPPFSSVEFSEAASKPRDDFFRDLLAQAVRKHNPENRGFKMGVVDVGDSGAGTKKMLELLRQIHAKLYCRQLWTVECHVFHEHPYPWTFKQYERHVSPFVVVVDCYRTLAGKKLLDDWTAAIGMAKVQRSTPYGVVSIPEIFEVERPAAIIVATATGYEAFVSKTGKHAANQILSKFTLESLTTSPTYKRTPQFDRWKRPGK